jgi:ribonucleoside-diphosphate reductase alpha chain
MSNGIKVTKRSGEIESLDLDKMHKMVDEATRGLSGVSASQVEMQSGIQFYDGVTTDEIQEILIRSASDLIDLEHPNYQFVAARLLLFSLRKRVFENKKGDAPSLRDHITKCAYKGLYDKQIFEKYSLEEIDKYLHGLIMTVTCCSPMLDCDRL